MYVQTGKTFIATLIAVVIALGGLAWLSSDGKKSEPSAAAQTAQLTETAQSAAPQPAPAYDSSTTAANNATGQSSYEDGYRAGYRDGHQDCSTSQNTSASHSYYRSHSGRRVRVAGATYYAAGAAPRKTHSTRNMILRIAAPAAIGAGIGGIVHGGKGAGIGALLGGGGGALYQLIKHPRD